MSEETVNIRIPDPLELTQYRIQVGDTVEFIEKMTGTQNDLDAFSGQLNLTVADMQSAANQITARYAQILQTGQQVADDKSTVEQLRTETGQDRQAAEQAAIVATQKSVIATDAAAVSVQQRGLAEQAATTATQKSVIATDAAAVSVQQRGLAEQAAIVAQQAAIEAGPTNLSIDRTATTLTVQSSTGADAVLPAATTALAGLMTGADKQLLGTRQAQLVSGTNIKTINGQSILGAGNITITPAAADVLTAYASAQFGAVGTYALVALLTANEYQRGSTIVGSQLRPAGLHQVGYNSIGNNYGFAAGTAIGSHGNSYPTLAGTWRVMSQLSTTGQTALVTMLCMRIL